MRRTPSAARLFPRGLMNRRDFVKSTTAAVAALSVPETILALAPETASRLVLPINRNWRYSAKRVPNDNARAFDDSRFDRVTIPHTNRRMPWHSFDDKDYEFVSIYRRHFRLPAGASGRRVFVDFGGAMTASTVWI